ncbi:11581_t:CDS:2, partial [Scutellospora calospora]
SEISQRLKAQHLRYSASSSSKQNSISYQDKTILIHKNMANRFEFYDKKRKWYGVKEDFCRTIIEAYKRINDESEAIAKKTNGRIDMHKSGNYTLTTIKFFKETTLAPQKNLATTGTLIFAKRYEEKANQYDVNSMYIFEMIKKDVLWPIVSATIERNSSKKSLQCIRYLQYNSHRIYIHYDLEYTKENGLKENILYNIKKESRIARKSTSMNKTLLATGKVELKTGIEI